jgi:hypothetical protein
MNRLTLIAVGFLLATAVVIALARASTARWEHDKRASAKVRADISTRRAPSAGSAFRMPREMTRRGVAALRNQSSRFPPRKLLAQLLPTDMKQATSRVRPLRRLEGVFRPLSGGTFRGGRWTKSRPPVQPVEGDMDGAAGETLPGPPPSRLPTNIESIGPAPTAGPQLLPSAVPRACRRVSAFLMRHERPQDARILHEDPDGRPTP